MIKWIFAIFVILDCIYQIFANSKSIHWAAYYDFLHYSTLLAISIYFMLNYFSKIYHIFTAYFIAILSIIIFDYTVHSKSFNVEHNIPLFVSSIIILLILTIFIIWMKLKKAGKL